MKFEMIDHEVYVYNHLQTRNIQAGKNSWSSCSAKEDANELFTVLGTK